jgi:hypothetical protein
VQQLVGTNPLFTVERVADQLRDMIVAQLRTVLATHNTSVLDLAAKYAEVGSAALDGMSSS